MKHVNHLLPVLLRLLLLLTTLNSPANFCKATVKKLKWSNPAKVRGLLSPRLQPLHRGQEEGRVLGLGHGLGGLVALLDHVEVEQVLPAGVGELEEGKGRK